MLINLFALLLFLFRQFDFTGPCGEPRRVEGKILFFPYFGVRLLCRGAGSTRVQAPKCHLGWPQTVRHVKTLLFYEVASYKNSQGEYSTA